jgi:hypothetical protein
MDEEQLKAVLQEQLAPVLTRLDNVEADVKKLKGDGGDTSDGAGAGASGDGDVAKSLDSIAKRLDLIEKSRGISKSAQSAEEAAGATDTEITKSDAGVWDSLFSKKA